MAKPGTCFCSSLVFFPIDIDIDLYSDRAQKDGSGTKLTIMIRVLVKRMLQDDVSWLYP